MTSRPQNRTALRAEENRPRPAQPAGQGQRGDRPDPVEGLRQRPCAAQPPGRGQQPTAHRGQLGLQPVEHPQVGGDLGLPRRGQAAAGQLGQLGRRVRAAEVTEGRRALVEQQRVHALHPRGVLGAQVMVEFQPGTPGRETAGSSIPAVGPGPAGPAAAARRSWRASRGRGPPRCPRAGPGAPRSPPAAAPRRRTASRYTLPPQRHLLRAAEPAGQPDPQVLPVRRDDRPRGNLPGHGVKVVEGDLLPVDIRSAYDRWHRDLLTLRGQCPNTPIVVRLS